MKTKVNVNVNFCSNWAEAKLPCYGVSKTSDAIVLVEKIVDGLIYGGIVFKDRPVPLRGDLSIDEFYPLCGRLELSGLENNPTR